MITNVIRENAAENVSYQYDALDRLTSASASYLTASYGWDLAGNPSSRTENGTNTSYTLGVGNKLVSWTGGSYGHDSAGCVTNIARGGNSLALAWNSRYQLTAVSTNGTVAESYTYGPLGNRISTVVNGVTNHHVYEGAHCVADLAADGDLVRSYQPGPGVDNWLSMTVHTGATPVVYTYLTDHLGTVHAVANASGAIVESYRYDPHGKVLGVWNGSGTPLTKSAIGNRILWQGREYSWTTGLYYFRARWYDPITGRWLSNDPIGISGGLNQYVFCGDNPVMFRDPCGLAEIALGFTKPLGDMSAEEATRLGKLITHNRAFTVTGHGLYLGAEGDPVHVSVAMGNSESPVYAKDLAKRIFGHDVYEPGMDVYLDGCNTGNRTSAYPVPFAKKVSDALYALTKSSGKRSRVMGTPGPISYIPYDQGLEPQASVRFKDRRLRYISF